MKTSDFAIGDRFKTWLDEWLVTDVGSRVIVAIPSKPSTADWEAGPPYALTEIVFDEHDLPAMEKITGG
jgi:hypothetical protein